MKKRIKIQKKEKINNNNQKINKKNKKKTIIQTADKKSKLHQR